MATVYLATHQTLKSLHALKVLRVDVPEIKRRLMSEGRVQSAIRHPNVVSVTDIVDAEHGVALVMEYVDGPALDEYQNERPLPIDEVIHLFRGITLGVGEAHRIGVVHRDLKAANILLHRTSNAGVIAKVTDFGLVKVFDGGGTRSGVTMGTPEYMSPEQVRDSANVDPRADLWSLGVLLYEMLTGTVPFDGNDLLEIYNAIAKASYVPASELRSEIPAYLDQIINDLLVVDPELRLPDAASILARLDREETLAAPPVPVAPASSSLRWPLLVVGAMAAAASATACLGGGLWYSMRGPGPALERSVEVKVVGLDNLGETTLRFGANRYAQRSQIDLGVHPVDTSLSVGWSMGPGCDDCPETCPAWCATGERSFVVPEGDGPLVYPLHLDAPRPQSVVVTANRELSGVFFDGERIEVEGATFTRSGVVQGEHVVIVEEGSCTSEVRGCSDTPDGCPVGCVSVMRSVVVGANSGGQLALDLPEVVAPKPVAVVAPEPVVAPYSSWISNARFARFTERQPEWSKQAAIDSKRADAGYLRNWSDGPPPGPVTRVTWAAARAYCAGRGGLLGLEDEPFDWTSSTVRQEWRDAGGRPGWRRADGVTSTQAVANKSFPLTGFRCRR